LQLAGAINDLPADGEIVLVNTWPDTKDHLVGIDLDRDIRKAANWSVVAGVLFILFSALLLALEKRKSRVPVDVHP
jgi:hypothetical protein